MAKKGEEARPVRIDDDKDKPKTVHLTHVTLSDPELPDDVVEEIAQRVEKGACVLVIRNTVALAQKTYSRMKTKLNAADDNERVGLLHSRYPHYQRFGHPDREGDKGREALWVERLGKHRQHRPKHGCVLVEIGRAHV